MTHRTSNAELTSETVAFLDARRDPVIAETSIPLLAAYEIRVARSTQDRRINDEAPLDSSFNPTRHTEIHHN